MSDMKKILDALTEMATVSGSVATVSAPLGSTRTRSDDSASVYSEQTDADSIEKTVECDDSDSTDVTNNVKRPSNFGLWQNSYHQAEEQQKKKSAKKSVKKPVSEAKMSDETSELDRPEIQAAMSRMKASYDKDPRTKDQEKFSRDLGLRLQAAAKQSEKKHKTEKLEDIRGPAGLRSLKLAEQNLEEADLILNPFERSKKKPRDIFSKTNQQDREVSMARSDLLQCIKNSERLMELLASMSDRDNLEAWVQEKIVKATDYLNTITEYLEGKATLGEGVSSTVHDINMKMMKLLDQNKQTKDPKEKQRLKSEFQKLKTERNKLLNIDSKDTTTGALDEGEDLAWDDPDLVMMRRMQAIKDREKSKIKSIPRDGHTEFQGIDREIDRRLKSEKKSSVKEGIPNSGEDPNLHKAYMMGSRAYLAYREHPEQAQRVQDKIEAEFPQYAKMWLTGYRDSERFSKQEVSESDSIKKIATKVSTSKPIGFKVADIGPGGREHNVKTDAEWDKQAKSTKDVAEAYDGDPGEYFVLRHRSKLDIEREITIPKLWEKIKQFDGYQEAKRAYDEMKSKYPKERFTITTHRKRDQEVTEAYDDSMTDAEWEREYQREKSEKEQARKEIQKNYVSQFKTKDEAIEYAKEKLKTFKDSKIGMSVYEMPDGGFDVCSTARTAAAQKRSKLISDVGGKHLGTLGPRYTKHKMKEDQQSMSRAAKGNEKYGKDGMKALAKAGREGASEKKLDTIRDKYDNYNESVAGPEKCWPGHRKVGTQPGTGKNAGKRVNKCEKIDERGSAAEQLDEISSKLAGEYYGAVSKKHVDKVGMRPNMYDRIERDLGTKRKQGMDRAFDRMTRDENNLDGTNQDVAENNWSHDPWKDKYFGPTSGAIKKIFKITVQDDESNVKAFNVKAETEDQAREIIEKHVPGSTVKSIKFVKNLMGSQDVAEAFGENLSPLKSPKKDDPYEQGWRTFFRRGDESDNPYERGTPEYQEWLNGYQEGESQPGHYDESVNVSEKGPGLWANIHAKRERIKAGSGERMRKPGSKGAPSAEDLKTSRTPKK